MAAHKSSGHKCLDFLTHYFNRASTASYQHIQNNFLNTANIRHKIKNRNFVAAIAQIHGHVAQYLMTVDLCNSCHEVSIFDLMSYIVSCSAVSDGYGLFNSVTLPGFIVGRGSDALQTATTLHPSLQCCTASVLNLS